MTRRPAQDDTTVVALDDAIDEPEVELGDGWSASATHAGAEARSIAAPEVGGGARVILSAPVGPDGGSRSVEVTLEPGERLVGVRLEREAQLYVSDRGRGFAVAADGTLTIREEG